MPSACCGGLGLDARERLEALELGWAAAQSPWATSTLQRARRARGGSWDRARRPPGTRRPRAPAPSSRRARGTNRQRRRRSGARACARARPAATAGTRGARAQLDAPEAVPGQRVVGLELRRFVERRLRGMVGSFLSEDHAEVGPRERVARGQPGRVPQRRQRTVDVPVRTERRAEVDAVRGVGRLEARGLRDRPRRPRPFLPSASRATPRLYGASANSGRALRAAWSSRPRAAAASPFASSSAPEVVVRLGEVAPGARWPGGTPRSRRRVALLLQRDAAAGSAGARPSGRPWPPLRRP